ncbi:MAG: hypothetical protein LBD24_06210 [Spirochaetaceae bacterium]|nr:hypothetical protein [Spirochaetaceae bacterium]
MHYFETTGGHAVPPAPPADRVLHYSETTRGPAETAGGGPPAAGGTKVSCGARLSGHGLLRGALRDAV